MTFIPLEDDFHDYKTWFLYNSVGKSDPVSWQGTSNWTEYRTTEGRIISTELYITGLLLVDKTVLEISAECFCLEIVVAITDIAKLVAERYPCTYIFYFVYFTEL